MIQWLYILNILTIFFVSLNSTTSYAKPSPNLREMLKELKSADGKTKACRDVGHKEFRENVEIIRWFAGKFVDPRNYPNTLEGFETFIADLGIKDFDVKELVVAHKPSHAKACGYKDGILLPPRCRWVTAAALFLMTQEIRTYLGRPITVRNWWRPRCYNSKVRGAHGSDHVQARALDLDFADEFDREDAQRALCSQIWYAEKKFNMQIGLGAVTIHLGLGSTRGRRCWYYGSYGKSGKCKNPCAEVDNDSPFSE